MPWSAVVAGAPLGLAMFQSAKVIGIEALTWIGLAERRACTPKLTTWLTPCMLRLPSAGSMMPPGT